MNTTDDTIADIVSYALSLTEGMSAQDKVEALQEAARIIGENAAEALEEDLFMREFDTDE